MYKSKGKFDANKTKVNLKMLTNRFQLLTQKKANLAKQQKRQVAMLLRDDKEQNARILVEHIIREVRTARLRRSAAAFHTLCSRHNSACKRPEPGLRPNLIPSLHLAPACSGLHARVVRHAAAIHGDASGAPGRRRQRA
jgi:vacuolar protein sorting-associated protein IST1